MFDNVKKRTILRYKDIRYAVHRVDTTIDTTSAMKTTGYML